MRFSRFLYKVQINKKITALYHSLTMKVVFLSNNLLLQIEDLFVGLTSSNSVIKSAIQTLCSLGLIIDLSNEDDALLKSITDSLPLSTIAVMYLFLTDACNFACHYCFIENQFLDKENHSFMTTNTARRAIDFYAQAIRRSPKHFNRRKTVTFYGGEPLLNKEVFRESVIYLTKLKEKGTLPDSLTVSVITNGSCLTPQLAKFMRDYNVQISVSLDGNAVATNLHRCDQLGRPVFDQVVEKIYMLQELGIPVGISCTINEETLRDTNETIGFIIDKLGVKGVGFNIILRGSPVPVSAGYEERASMFILKAYELFRQNEIFENRIMRKVRAFTKQQIYYYDCSATGGNQIVVAPDGSVGICHGYIGSRKYFVGTVFDQSLVVEKTPVYQAWRKRTPLLMTQCQQCIALGICGGGCPCNAEMAKGSIWELDERFCIHAKMTLDWLIRDLWQHSKHSIEKKEK